VIGATLLAKPNFFFSLSGFQLLAGFTAKGMGARRLVKDQVAVFSGLERKFCEELFLSGCSRQHVDKI